MENNEQQQQQQQQTQQQPQQQMIHGMTPNTFVGLMNILFIVPSVGWIASLVFWLIGKDQSERVNIAGRDMLNWVISLVIYSVAALIFCFIIMFIPFLGAFIGILVSIALGLYSLVCPIIAGVKAFNGETWKYPFTIPIIK